MSTMTGSPLTTVTSNTDPDTGTWVASMPLETRLALAAAEDAGVGVSDYEDPIFYEVEIDFTRLTANIANIVAVVCETVDAEMKRHGVEQEHRVAIREQIRASGYSTPGGFHANLGQVMRWVTVTGGSDDD